MDNEQRCKHIALSNFKNHDGMKAIVDELRQMYLIAVDTLEKSDRHEDMIRAQAKIEAINQIAGLFEKADFVANEARREMIEDRLKPMTTPAE